MTHRALTTGIVAQSRAPAEQPRHLRRAEVGAIAAIATQRMAPGLKAEIGRLAVDTRSPHAGERRSWQITSEALPQFGGCEFRFEIPSVNFASASSADITQEVVLAADKFRRSRPSVIRLAQDVQELTAKLTAWFDCSFAPICFGTPGVQIHDHDGLKVLIDVETLDADLPPVSTACRGRRWRRSRAGCGRS